MGFMQEKAETDIGNENDVRGREKVILLPLTNVVVLPFPIFLPSMKVPFELLKEEGQKRRFKENGLSGLSKEDNG